MKHTVLRTSRNFSAIHLKSKKILNFLTNFLEGIKKRCLMMVKQRFFTTRRGGQIRTDDLLVPNQARYRATLRPVTQLRARRY